MEGIHIVLSDLFPFLGENGAAATLDVYRNPQAKNAAPCLLICPGGAYYGISSMREGTAIVDAFAQTGYHACVLHYSVSPHHFPTQLREVAAAMEVLYAHADEWNIDTAKIAIMGFSAGGHLAAHYSNAYDCDEVRARFPESKAVNASILCYPVITADPSHGHMGSFEGLLGHLPNDRERDRFSCERLVTEHTPPAFVWHTIEDNLVPVQNAILYTQALIEHGVPAELHLYPFGAHGLATCDEITCNPVTDGIAHAGEWIEAAKRWLALQFK